MWALLAATRQETFGESPTLVTVFNPTTNGLDTGADAVRTLAAPVAPAQPAVAAITHTPPLAFLQQLPVVGPTFVTPIVAFVHQIPVVSDLLHPVIGYPAQIGLPAGSPLPRDVKVISFDSTPIYVHFMPARGLQTDQRVPTILFGPGLPLPGATNIDGTVLDGIITDFFGQVSIATLRNAGYNVVTWDPRGEYNSGGVLEVNSPDFEGRDVSAIISWLATQPEVQLDSELGLDPRIGMVGASYGGSIQLVTAAIDHRVDAIVPTIAPNSLNSSLYKSEAFKSSLGTTIGGLLVLTGARPHPRIYPALVLGDLIGMVMLADQQLLAERGPDYLLKSITAPTLLIQGVVDTWFTLQEAHENANALMANGVPTKVLWFCGGHGRCANNRFDLTDGVLIEQRTLEWLDRYVKGDTSVSTGPQFEWVDQHGQWFSSDVYPVVYGDPIVASRSAGGVLPLLPFIGGSGFPFLEPYGAKAINAVNFSVPATSTTTYVVGAPQLTLTYSGSGTSRHVYAQLVDDTTGLVLGSQVTPIPVTLDGHTHTLTLPLEQVAHTFRPGETMTLQLVASGGTYTQIIPTLGVLNVSSMQLTLPTAAYTVAESPRSSAEVVAAA
jgi:ABC-2 type transport system ATP-binding protein